MASPRERRPASSHWDAAPDEPRIDPDFEDPRAHGREPGQPRGGRIVLVLIAAIVVLFAIAGGLWFLVWQGKGTTPVIATSISPASPGDEAAPPSAASSTFVAGPGDIKATPGNTVSSGKDGDGAATAIVTSTQQSASPAGATGGANIAVPAATAQVFSGNSIIVTVTARASAIKPTARFAVAYSAGSLGNSGWITFVPTAAFQPYELRLRVPASQSASDNYVGLWSDVSGLGLALEVKNVEIRLDR